MSEVKDGALRKAQDEFGKIGGNNTIRAINTAKAVCGEINKAEQRKAQEPKQENENIDFASLVSGIKQDRDSDMVR